MKFYNIKVFVRMEDNKLESFGKTIVEQTATGYREPITKLTLSNIENITLKQNRLLQNYGFFFCITESDCVEKNYARKEDVEKYLQEIEQHPFHQFVNEHQYVYGKDAKEVKQMIKQYRKNK